MQRNHRISGIHREFDERFMFHTEQDSGIMFVKGYCLLAMFRQVFLKSGSYKKRELRCKDIEQFPNLKESMGGHYAGENYGSADIALQYGGPWDPWSNWNADDKPHLQKNAEKYRKQKHRHEKHPRSRQQSADQPEEKWLRLWKTRDRLLHRMNRLVWYPALLSTVILGCAIYFSKTLRIEEGLPLTYLYVGATVPVVLLLLRQALDFFLQRRAGDGYVGRLCGADEKLDRRDSSREKKRTLFYRKKSWIRLPVASSRQLLPEVISVRC